MLSTLVSILALGFIIFFHELGHYLFARLFHVGVVEFMIGLGPKIVSVQRGRTRWSICGIPFGGACSMLSDDGMLPEEDRNPDGSVEVNGIRYEKSEQLTEKPAWQRFFIYSGGALFNFLLALWLSFVLTGLIGSDRPLIVSVNEGSPAQEAGIEAGDTVTKILVDGRGGRVTFARDIQMILNEQRSRIQDGSEVELSFLDASENGAPKTVRLTAAPSEKDGRRIMGFSYSLVYTPVKNSAELIRFSTANVLFCIRSTVMSLRMLVAGSVSRDDVMGPVRMVAEIDQTVGKAAESSLLNAALTLMNMMILISGSLGCMNLLPIPALDGGRLVFLFLEMLLRRPVPRRFEAAVHAGGMLFLLFLMFMILFNDITYLVFGR